MPREETALYTALLEAIDRGEYPPGARLVETELAERFSVSRTPVREALSRLQSQGVVAHDGKRGLTVAMLDYDQLGELFAIREVLESFAARLAARSAAPAEISLLREMVTADADRVDDLETLARSNRQFHRQLHRASHNRYLTKMLDTMRRSLILLTGSSLRASGRGRESIMEHDAIVSAIEARDEDAAEAATRRHILKAYKARLELFAEQGGNAP